MKKEDKVSKKKGIKKGPSIKTAISRAKRIGNGIKKAVVGAAIVGTLLGSPIDFTNITRVQATETDAGTTDVKKLPKVSLKELKGLDKKHGKPNIIYLNGEPMINNPLKNWLCPLPFFTGDYGKSKAATAYRIDVPIPGRGLGEKNFVQFQAFVYQGMSKKGEVFVTHYNKKGEKVAANIKLDKLAKLYKQETGKELKYVKLVGENGVDKDGPFSAVYVVPIDYFGQYLNEVKSGTPTLSVGYWLNDDNGVDSGVSYGMGTVE